MTNDDVKAYSACPSCNGEAQAGGDRQEREQIGKLAKQRKDAQAEVERANQDFCRRVERELYDDPEFARVSTNAVNGLLNRLLAWTDATKGETNA